MRWFSRKGLSRLELEVLAVIERHNLLAPGERVAVACSGGADSTALLHLLLGLAKHGGWVVSVAHFNHCLRGEESEQDAAFVRGLAAGNSLDLHESACDVRAHARSTRMNLEAAARRLRYEFLRSLVASGQVHRVAVGHTVDDQAETVLLRLVRGSGMRGLAGIRPRLHGGIIRPLIETRGQDLRDWLSTQSIAWREDSSNRNQRLRRNLIRHSILPVLNGINPSVARTLSRTAMLAQVDEDFWNGYVRHLANKHCLREGSTLSIRLSALRRLPAAAAYRLLRWALSSLLGPSGTNLPEQAGSDSLRYQQIRRLHEWALRPAPIRGGESQSCRALALPRRLEARVDSRSLVLSVAPADESPEGQKDPGAYNFSLTVPGRIRAAEAGIHLQIELIALAGEAGDYNGSGKFLLDSSLAKHPLVLRNWRPGDAYQPMGRHKSRKLKELFQRHRIPIRQRGGWPVLVCGDRIVWSRLFGFAGGVAVHPGAAEALRVTVEDLAASNKGTGSES